MRSPLTLVVCLSNIPLTKAYCIKKYINVANILLLRTSSHTYISKTEIPFYHKQVMRWVKKLYKLLVALKSSPPNLSQMIKLRRWWLTVGNELGGNTLAKILCFRATKFTAAEKNMFTRLSMIARLNLVYATFST